MIKRTYFAALLLFALATLSAQTVEVQGNLSVTGGLRLAWIDTSASVIALPLDIYGVRMDAPGIKTLVMPLVTASVVGQVYCVTNKSNSGNINIATIDFIDGSDKIQPGRTVRIEARDLNTWIVTLY